jgi:hypothetical protein
MRAMCNLSMNAPSGAQLTVGHMTLTRVKCGSIVRKNAKRASYLVNLPCSVCGMRRTDMGKGEDRPVRGYRSRFIVTITVAIAYCARVLGADADGPPVSNTTREQVLE